MPLRTDIHKVLVIGSGPIVIGQAAEFDYAGTQACLALKEENIEVVLINNNPATIMTDEKIADKVYIEPLTLSTIEKIIEKEKPDGVIGTLGGQTGLNLTVELYEKGILDKYNVELLGTSVASIKKGEDREEFRQLMIDIEEPISESKIIHSFAEGQAFVKDIGYPVIIRPAYTLGGSGGGFATNDAELETVLKRGLTLSPIHQVLIEKSIKGWKEIEYEVMRDANDTCVIVCNMENLDPVGVHTGDSIVVAPSQTLSDVQYQLLRSASLKVIRALNIVGGCNIQFALNPYSNDYIIIEVNPRVSRSSALASKATGYPIARIAAKCAIGFNLDEIINPITGTTFASFEPAIDYAVVKLPRFPFDKFTEGARELGTQMKATGEVMAIDRTFEGALNKGLRSLEMGRTSLHYPAFKTAEEEHLLEQLSKATDLRLYAITELMMRGKTIEEIHQITQIDPWFLEKIKSVLEVEQQLSLYSLNEVPEALFKYAKQINLSDQRLSEIFAVTPKQVREKWKAMGLSPGYKLVDTCAAEFEAQTPYYYSTWTGEDEAEVSGNKKILVIGSGPIRIGQGIEFDYCSVQAALAVKAKGYEAIVMNNNPETVSTDYSIADRLYFEPLAIEDILNVIEKEKVEGVLLQFGGQTAINLANDLEEAGVTILGTTTKAIDQLEDRQSFYDLLNDLEIPHIDGTTVHNAEELYQAAEQLGYPILVRPSYVIGGQSMFIFYDKQELMRYVQHHADAFTGYGALLVDRYISGIECEVDAVSDGQDVFIPGAFEHIEKAGVHSGDSTALFPSVSLTKATLQKLESYTNKICKALNFKGLMNIQFVIDEQTQTVYVLEVNPRSSRTIPIVSKVTGVPMVEVAVGVQLGETLASQGLKSGLINPEGFYTVKAPVFSTEKLQNVDPVLGPEMKSTGERLGIGQSVDEALSKALIMDDHHPFDYMNEKPFLFCSVNKRDQLTAVPLIKALQLKGFKIMATPSTAASFQSQDIEVDVTTKDLQEVKQFMSTGKISAVINIPTQGRNHETFGFRLRELALRYQVPLFTSIDTAVAMAQLLEKTIPFEVHTLLGYRQSSLSITGSE